MEMYDGPVVMVVAGPIPMNRELKGELDHAVLRAQRVAVPIPMNRELKV